MAAVEDFDPRPPMPKRISGGYGGVWWHPYWSLRAEVLLDGVRLEFVFRADAEEGWAEVGVVERRDARGNVRLRSVPNEDGDGRTFERAVLRGRLEFVPKAPKRAA